MAKSILTNVRLFTGGADLTASNNKAEVTAEVEEKDVTTFRPEGDADSGWRQFIGGLGSGTVSAEGFWEAGDLSLVDDQSWANVGGRGPWTVAPVGAAVGSLAYSGLFLSGNYTAQSGSVGDVAGYQLDGMSSSPLVRGAIAHPPGTARTTTGTGTSLNLGAVAAGRRLYAALHVLSATGTGSMVVTVQTDDATGFASAATALTFASFATASSPQGQWLSSDGTAITDTWQRAQWTVTGTLSALFVVAIGIA